ncbi:hypothetical protein KHC23_15930 [Ancylobacter dichloromethanicus]|uniref:FkbM family methyltransferase n=1 Tax=Ancylobacter dichloromethanicus TaxID=518825 RepID=A0A9W6MZA5_9HYPH|nr:hypothetical protein [Ancylobacter dichloromethanicus]MBS7555133.1 hypothetical protein [Ancylobacter dichloromethanicus]GLK72504.1 hypothetical protein GCM10017643_26200 [Ancylobacter dichloromethanicus]
MSYIGRLVNALERLGPLGLARRTLREVYARTLRPLLPRSRPVVYSGVTVALYRHVGDDFAGRMLGSFGIDDVPRYEETLLIALRAHVRPGDTIVIVGGGAGITAVVAGRLVGESGRVICFEGSKRQVDLIRGTIAINGLADRVTIRHAIVGPAIGVYGEAGAAASLSAADIPPCDVLELDCEGSEIDILQNLAFSPRIMLVETHGMYGASSELCEQLLEARGYRVATLGYAEPRVAAFCESNDIRILAGEAIASNGIVGAT